MNKFTARILIVEDDPQIRNFISYVLSAEGFASDNAATAQSAMTLLAANVYDLMLLDLGLPDYDGMDVIRKVREWSEIPILVVSARDQDQEKAQALDAGADDYLTKPFHNRVDGPIRGDPACSAKHRGGPEGANGPRAVAGSGKAPGHTAASRCI
ncbi:MAG: response regulator [Merdibacter sp.]